MRFEDSTGAPVAETTEIKPDVEVEKVKKESEITPWMVEQALKNVGRNLELSPDERKKLEALFNGAVGNPDLNLVYAIPSFLNKQGKELREHTLRTLAYGPGVVTPLSEDRGAHIADLKARGDLYERLGGTRDRENKPSQPLIAKSETRGDSDEKREVRGPGHASFTRAEALSQIEQIKDDTLREMLYLILLNPKTYIDKIMHYSHRGDFESKVRKDETKIFGRKKGQAQLVAEDIKYYIRLALFKLGNLESFLKTGKSAKGLDFDNPTPEQRSLMQHLWSEVSHLLSPEQSRKLIEMLREYFPEEK